MGLPGGYGDLSDGASGDEGVLTTTPLAADGSVDAQALARNAIQQLNAQTNPNAGESGITHQEGAQETVDGVVSEEGQVQEGQQIETQQTEVTDLREIEAALAEAGIDLGIDSSKLPKEMLPVYQQLVKSAVDLAEDALSKQLEASNLQRSMQEFSDRLKNSPDKVLLALAVNQPEMFKKVHELMSEMDSDPRVKNAVLTELASEARMMEVQRREQSLKEQYQVNKANQVIAATRRSARTHGVNFETAEKIVALAVKANGGDLDVSAVDGIVLDLKGLPKAPPKPAVRTPQQQAAVNRAPTSTPAPNVATTSKGSPATKGGLTDGTSNREGGGGAFRALIKSASARIVSR